MPHHDIEPMEPHHFEVQVIEGDVKTFALDDGAETFGDDYYDELGTRVASGE